ncbi:MAG: hypothetical protein SOH58_04050 [Olsenella sp.]|jgi:hypothetical protein
MSDEAPAPITMAATPMALRYSILPCPKGCSRSAGFDAMRIPTTVTTEEAASVRLFTASSTMASEPAARPTRAFATTSATLTATPT